MEPPELKVTVFSDYMCPFCYVGHHRLMRLKDSFDLKINWCFVQIRPHISTEGEPVTALNYSADHWKRLLDSLEGVAAEENIPLAEIRMICNSRDAMLLAEAAKILGRERFYALHEAIFQAYFVRGKNIGDRKVLLQLCEDCGIDQNFAETAWHNPQHAQRLRSNITLAQQQNIRSVPAFDFGNQVLAGVVSEQRLREAASGTLQQPATAS